MSMLLHELLSASTTAGNADHTVSSGDKCLYGIWAEVTAGASG